MVLLDSEVTFCEKYVSIIESFANVHRFIKCKDAKMQVLKGVPFPRGGYDIPAFARSVRLLTL